jgi:oxaloacetate decarboxylase (Na+ extruding) subunit alpha
VPTAYDPLPFEFMNLERIEKLVKLFGGSRAEELTVEADGWNLRLRRNSGPTAALPADTPMGPLENDLLVPEPPAICTVEVTAPLVGIFRQGEERLAPGDLVQSGAPVGAIESLKILNPVVAEVSGEVLEVLVEDGHPVEYGQPLFVVLPAPEPDVEEAEE